MEMQTAKKKSTPIIGETNVRNSTFLPSIENQKTAKDIGTIFFLLSQSPFSNFTFKDADWLFFPAIMLGQYKIYFEEEKPIGFVLWAFVSDEVEGELEKEKNRLTPLEWNSGKNCWIMNLFLVPEWDSQPRQHQIFTEVASGPFKGKDVKFFFLDPEDGKKRFVKFKFNNGSIK